MSIEKIDLNSSYLSMYLENGKGLIFNHFNKSLYSVSSEVVAFVFAIDDGLSKLEALHEISDYFNLSSGALALHYQEAYSLFSNSALTSHYLDSQYPELSQLQGTSELNQTLDTVSYVVDVNTSFSIKCNHPILFQQITTLLKPIQKTRDKVHFQLAIVQVENDRLHFDIYCNNLMIEKHLLLKEVTPLIIDRMQILTYQHSDYYFCFHGAALKTQYGMLLLPGNSGAGKSTLSAVLAAKNNQLYSDEMIVLDKDFNIKTLNLPIAIKSGSWNVLSQHYPELNDLPECLREDGRRLKYVWPKPVIKNVKTKSTALKQCLIINPNYDKNCVDEKPLEYLSVIDTLTMLIGAGYQVGIELNEEWLEALLSFIENAERYRLSYNTSKQAEIKLNLLWN